jgi:hypothetical protein
MNFLTQTILRRLLAQNGMSADLARLPAAYRNAGRRFMNPIAAAGLLRLALRWPALAWMLILAVIASRVLSSRQQEPPDATPVPENTAH